MWPIGSVRKLDCSCEVEIEDNHGPDEDEVEAFGREWADLVLQNAPESEIDAVISKFKADIERLKLAIESGEIDPLHKNPLPVHYHDARCRDAIDHLHDEIVNVDLEKWLSGVKTRIQNNLRLDAPVSSDLISFIDSLDTLTKADQYHTAFAKLDLKLGRDVNLRRLKTTLYIHNPPILLMKNIQVVRGVKFVHTLPKSAADSIRTSGDLYGRRTPSRMTITTDVSDFYVKNKGYIFAYEHSRFFSGAEPSVNFPTYLEGTASHALSFYFIPDREYQVIIPVECIDSLDIVERSGVDTEQAAWDNRDDPSWYEVGAFATCWTCDSEFVLDEDALIDNAFVCRKCRD